MIEPAARHSAGRGIFGHLLDLLTRHHAAQVVEKESLQPVDDRLLLVLRLRQQQFERRHGDHPRRDAAIIGAAIIDIGPRDGDVARGVQICNDIPASRNRQLIIGHRHGEGAGLDAALGVGDHYLVEKAAGLLDPYAGRAVFDSGAVGFHGLTDDTLARAATVLGDDVAAARRRESALDTYTRLGAVWWRERLANWHPSTAVRPGALRLISSVGPLTV